MFRLRMKYDFRNRCILQLQLCSSLVHLRSPFMLVSSLWKITLRATRQSSPTSLPPYRTAPFVFDFNKRQRLFATRRFDFVLVSFSLCAFALCSLVLVSVSVSLCVDLCFDCCFALRNCFSFSHTWDSVQSPKRTLNSDEESVRATECVAWGSQGGCGLAASSVGCTESC